MKLPEYISEIIGWIGIALSPTLLGALGFIIYSVFPGANPKILLLIMASAGFVAGAIWAPKIWRKTGTMNFLSRVSSTSDLNPPDENHN